VRASACVDYGRHSELVASRIPAVPSGRRAPCAEAEMVPARAHKGFCRTFLDFLKDRISRFGNVYLYYRGERMTKIRAEVCRKYQDSIGTPEMSRDLRYKNPDLDTRPEMASSENRHHQGNMSLSGGVNRSGRKGRGEVYGIPRRQREPASNRESPSFNPPIRQKRKIR
jgi:hypothetical protein